MWLYLWKSDLFTHEFWPIFQSLNYHKSHDIYAYNDLKFYLEKDNLFTYYLYKEN